MRLKPSLTTLLLAMGCFCILAGPLVASAQNNQERYSVQFRLPLDKNEVWNFVEMISGLGYPSYMYTEESADGATYYYAQMGSYASIVDAIDAASALNKKVSVQYDVVHTNTNSIVKLGTAPDAPTAKAQAAPPKKPEAKAADSEPDAEEYDEPVINTPEPPSVAAPEAPKTPQAPQTPAAPVMAKDSPASTPPAAAPEQAEEDKIYLLQIFSFEVRNNAIQTAKNYKNKGYDPFIIKLYDSKDKEWFVVSVGYARTQEQAATLAAQFAQKEGKRPTLNNVNANFLNTRIVPFK